VVLGIAGGGIGVGGGFAFNRLYIGVDAPLSWDWVGYSFAICAGIGAIAGSYPALRAANENVIEALRYE
jgi:ABC-type antimicrobial peptide transport system permease subunit